MRALARYILIASSLLAGAAYAAPAAPLFDRLPDISGPDGRWDFASWDNEHGRVIVAHGNDVLVVDPRNPATVRAIGQVQHAHAAMAIPGGNKVLVSSGADNTLRILDAESGAQLASIPVAGDPDATVLKQDGRTAYVMGAESGEISVVDLAHAVETARIKVKPALEVPVLFGQHMLAVNDEDLGEIELVDLREQKLIGSIRMPGCTGPTGLALAPEQGLALSSCANGKAALVDLRNRRVVRLLPIGLGPDTVIWDAPRSRFLVPCGKSGTLSVIALTHRGAQVVANVPTETSARTAALDPATGRMYLPAARYPAAAAAIGLRPQPVPGSFHLVVLAPLKPA